MEVSKAFQADIRRIQNQLKIAILNHQVMVKKKNEDPTNIHIQVQLRDAQRHIISLGEIQKQLIQRLRKELEANSTNSTLNNKTTIKCTEKDNDNDIEITQTKNCSSSSTGGIGSTVNTKNSITSGSEDTSKTENGIIYCSPGDNLENSLEDEIRLSEVSSPSSSSSSYSDDEREIQESLAAEISQEKIAFLQAVGLITREILSDLQNRRVERKRRSTANHTQFVYGSHWDVSKRKKNGYLLSTSPPAKTKRKPQVHQKQQLHQKDKHHISFAENDRIVLPVTSTLEKVAPVSSSVSQSSLNRQTTPDKTNASAYQITPKEISRSLLRTSGTNLPKTSLRLASLPASLTIERVNSPPNVCIICGSTGMLSSCKNCSVYFHPSCSKEASCCPKCNTDQGSTYIETKNGPNEPPNGLIIQQTTVPLQASFSGSSIGKKGNASVGRTYSKQDTSDQ